MRLTVEIVPGEQEKECEKHIERPLATMRVQRMLETRNF